MAGNPTPNEQKKTRQSIAMEQHACDLFLEDASWTPPPAPFVDPLDDILYDYSATNYKKRLAMADDVECWERAHKRRRSD